MIGDALQLGDHLQRGADQTQIASGRLMRSQHHERLLFQEAPFTVDEGIFGDDPAGQIRVLVAQRLQ